jgi:outer membrane protein OmpA-like peptidoglycan-associated protein
MKGKVIVLLVSCVLATTSWAGERHRVRHDGGSGTDKETGIGLGAGAAIGALGGPVGVVLGAAFGGWLGDRFHHERADKQAADQRYEQARTDLEAAEQKAATQMQELTAARTSLAAEQDTHRRDLEEALALEVLFRTEDSSLDDGTQQRLTRLAGLVAPMSGTVVRIEGHTDARGTEDYNDQLSALRAANVRDVLIRGGLPAERIVVTAAGESGAAAPEQDTDGMALERRVEITLVDGAQNRVASRLEP